MSLDSLVLGVLDGLLIGLVATGLVLVYRSSRFLNLSHAQLGTVPALLLAKFVINWGWSWWLAIVPCLAVGVGTGILVDRVVISPLRRRTASSAALLLMSIGVTQVLLALTFIPALNPDNDRLDVRGYPLPFHTHIQVGSVRLVGQYVLTLVLAPLLVAGIGMFLRYSVTGKMIRAAAANPDAARACGISIKRVSSITWGIAGGLAAITAILQAPSQGTFSAAALGPQLLFLALGAAAFGAFVSIPGALAGGLTLGVVQDVVLNWTGRSGDAELAVVMAILLAILMRGRAIGAAFATTGPVVEDEAPVRVPEVVRDRGLVRHRMWWLGGTALVVGIVAPVLPYFRTTAHNFELTLVIVNAMVGLSLTVLVGWAGQVSLGHFALVGVGAYVMARYGPHHWSLSLICVLAGVTGALVMTVVGLPALRVRGLTLTVTSLGLAVVAPDWLFRQGWFGSSQPFGLLVSPTHVLFGTGAPTTPRAMYYVALGVLVLGVLMVRALRQSVPGRLVIAVRDNDRAAAAFGVTPATVRLACLAFSGALASVSGVLWAGAWRSVDPGQFPPGLSLAILAVPIVGGLGSPGGAVAGAVVLYMATYFLSPSLSFLFGSFGQQLGFQLALGGGGVVAMMLFMPTGLAGVARRGWTAWLERTARTYERSPEVVPGPPLAVHDVSLSFGGVRALDGACIEVREREIVGLIGPNGAGKTTLLNAISGALTCDSGSIRVMGREVVDMPAEYRSALGLGRSFQDALLFPGLTVKETIQVAVAPAHRVGFVASSLSAPWARMANHSSARRAEEVMDRFGLGPYSDALTSTLSTGTRRICDLAAQVAAGPRIILLDEPAAGVAQREAEALGPLLRRIRDELDCSILVIEHDMPLLMDLCDRVYAMEAGRVIAEGTPAEIRADPAVIATYLGTKGTAVGRSGPARKSARTAKAARTRSADPKSASPGLSTS